MDRNIFSSYFTSMLSLTDYEYTLPEQLIAQHPVLPPENARLLVFDRTTQILRDHHFYDLPQLLAPGTLLIFNDSKVVKARLLFPEISGELLFLRLLTPTSCEALVRPGKKRKVGEVHQIATTDISFTVTESTEEGRIVQCSHPILDVLETYGQMPLPPYIEYTAEDAPRYQPVVANENKLGSVAAPTAALHFSEQLFHDLQKTNIAYTTVTLHVGIGTFKNVDVEDITTYQIHDELCEVNTELFEKIAQQKTTGAPLLAIGTTSTRTLESLPYLRQQLSYEHKILFCNTQTIEYRDMLTEDITTEKSITYVSHIELERKTKSITFSSTLYIYPGFQFRIVDQLITNFHLPKSSLLMLVSGYIGHEQMKQVYDHAVEQEYRFFSFGDGMLVL